MKDFPKVSWEVAKLGRSPSQWLSPTLAQRSLQKGHFKTALFTFQVSSSHFKAKASLNPCQGQSVIHHVRNQNIFLGAGWQADPLSGLAKLVPKMWGQSVWESLDDRPRETWPWQPGGGRGEAAGAACHSGGLARAG